MPAIFEIMFGGRICGCYILTISIEKQRKQPPFVCFLNYAWRTDGRAGGGVGPNVGPAVGALLGPTGYTFIVLARLYMALLKQLLIQFVIFTVLTKQANCRHRISALTQSDDKPPWRNQLGGTGHTVKMHTK